MILEILIAVFGFLGFILLLYTVILLIRRKEYESGRVLKGYNVLIFGILVLSLTVLIKGIKYVYLTFSGIGGDSLIYFDILSTLILLPIVGASFLASMFIFRSL
ncbi:MAG: hypothetical protein AABX08_03265 [Nanoarchaeota archaeon]